MVCPADSLFQTRLREEGVRPPACLCWRCTQMADGMEKPRRLGAPDRTSWAALRPLISIRPRLLCLPNLLLCILRQVCTLQIYPLPSCLTSKEFKWLVNPKGSFPWEYLYSNNNHNVCGEISPYLLSSLPVWPYLMKTRIYAKRTNLFSFFLVYVCVCVHVCRCKRPCICVCRYVYVCYTRGQPWVSFLRSCLLYFLKTRSLTEIWDQFCQLSQQAPVIGLTWLPRAYKPGTPTSSFLRGFWG